MVSLVATLVLPFAAAACCSPFAVPVAAALALVLAQYQRMAM